MGKFVLAMTGASGAIYMQRLLDLLDPRTHEIYFVASNHAQQVISEELENGKLQIPDGVRVVSDHTMNVPFVSGSALFDSMVIIPCSMSTVGRIATCTGESTILRAADVFLKEQRKLILVPRETPFNLVHVRALEQVMLAGAIVLPAMPSFYSRPPTIEALVDTVVMRVLDHLGVPSDRAKRWKNE